MNFRSCDQCLCIGTSRHEIMFSDVVMFAKCLHVIFLFGLFAGGPKPEKTDFFFIILPPQDVKSLPVTSNVGESIKKECPSCHVVSSNQCESWSM